MLSKLNINNLELYDEGGKSEFYTIKSNKRLGFKGFKNKKNATKAWLLQEKLSKYNLAPKTLSPVCQMPISEFSNQYQWGFFTERATVFNSVVMSKKLRQIQNLVDSIYTCTGLKFWDSHYFNIGYIKRNGKPKLVCIDTGLESFSRDCNAWGFSKPGPKCNYCHKYHCRCGEN